MFFIPRHCQQYDSSRISQRSALGDDLRSSPRGAAYAVRRAGNRRRHLRHRSHRATTCVGLRCDPVRTNNTSYFIVGGPVSFLVGRDPTRGVSFSIWVVGGGPVRGLGVLHMF
jgi:hypothetical protein